MVDDVRQDRAHHGDTATAAGCSYDRAAGARHPGRGVRLSRSASSSTASRGCCPPCTSASATRVYLHGSTGSRPLLAARGDGLPVCVTVTLLDGLVYARSQFHHSANYRSVVAHGTARLVTDEAEKRRR